MTQRVVVAHVWYIDSKDRKERKRERNNMLEAMSKSYIMST